MKKQLALTLMIFLGYFSYAQTNAIIKAKEGLSFNDLQRILYFEGINNEKFIIKSDSLKGKNYQIIIKEFKKGKLTKIDTVFNSKEDEYFRIKTDSLSFAVLTKMSDFNYFKIQFQFGGFSSKRKYAVLPTERDKFTLKSFFGNKSDLPINLKGTNYFLAYMMPYVRKDKSEAYCEVAQSGIDPEKLYDNYKIPHYYLIAIRFE
ncbi:MAG: hypothetical protein MUW56_20630 [Chryseobacterium sp.]|uniref:hypothetical protein n=1 Tax=Chryseobacterium sp. TaxID=1871047 RepID=UPI0025C66153|nr:hypothetical protein [Chryseobacterium sp.]MCJ7935964.1 hypothetical protein [Chryseobacterium sp.]